MQIAAWWTFSSRNLIVWSLWLLPAMSAAAQYDVPKPEDAAVAALRSAVTMQRDGSHLPVLFALRQLRDPDLKPLFYQLAQSGDWQSQVHAVLALAEIDPGRHVDPWLITQVNDQAQELVIANGLDLNMIAPDQIAGILSQDALNSMARLMLSAELLSIDQAKIDVAELERLSKSEDPYLAGFSAALLSQVGKPEPWTAYLKTIESQEPQARVRLTLWLLDAVGRYKLSTLANWVRAQAQSTNADEAVVFRTVYALLQLDPKTGLELWNQVVGDEPSAGMQVRYALALLAIGKDVPASAFDRLRIAGSDDLILDMAAAGSAISTDKDPSASLISLLNTGHLKTTDWVMSALNDLKPEYAAPVYKHLIDQVESTGEMQSDPVGLATKSVAKLLEIDPDWVFARLQGADDDGLLQQTILLGMFQYDSPRVAQAVSQVRRIGSGRADSLALLLIAKHSPTLSPEDLKQLGTIASGGGLVSDVLQVQAAWFYIKQTGNVQIALGSVFTNP